MEYLKLFTELILSTSEGDNVVKKRNENISYSASSLFIQESVIKLKKI